jgi:hypothetical protein
VRWVVTFTVVGVSDVSDRGSGVFQGHLSRPP